MVFSLTSVAGTASSDAKTEKSSIECIKLDSKGAVFVSNTDSMIAGVMLSVETGSKIKKVDKEKSKAVAAGLVFINSKRLNLRHPERYGYVNNYDYKYFPYTATPLIAMTTRQTIPTKDYQHVRC